MAKPIKIIGISGKIGSGKDTLASYLQKTYPQYEIRPFALKLKEFVADMTNTTLEQNLSREGKSIYPPGWSQSLGKLQQIIGTTARNILGEDIWINAAFANASSIIISDVRFPNEVRAIQSKGGIVIRLEGDPANIRKENNDGRDLQHISETALDGFEFQYVIQNDSTELELFARATRIVHRYESF